MFELNAMDYLVGTLACFLCALNWSSECFDSDNSAAKRWFKGFAAFGVLLTAICFAVAFWRAL